MHEHEFHGLWTHFGPFHNPDNRHYHPCMTDGCPAMLVGVGRDCGGPGTRHHVCKWMRFAPTYALIREYFPPT